MPYQPQPPMDANNTPGLAPRAQLPQNIEAEQSVRDVYKRQALAAADVFDKPVLSRLLNRGVSQNVVARYLPAKSPTRASQMCIRDRSYPGYLRHSSYYVR